MLHRRGFMTGLVSTLAAPAIVHAGNLMPIKSTKVLTMADYHKLMNEMLDLYVKEWHQRVADLIYQQLDHNGLVGTIIRSQISDIWSTRGTMDVYNPLGIKIKPIWTKDFYK